MRNGLFKIIRNRGNLWGVRKIVKFRENKSGTKFVKFKEKIKIQKKACRTEIR